MKSFDELFVLIKSLSRSEKRYFTLFAGTHSDSNKLNYFQLFEIIDKQTTYDEKKVIKSYFQKREEKHFSYEKKHLYELILKSLNKYHSEISKESILNESLNSAKILYKKGLYDQSNKILEKLIVFAKQNELYSGLFNVCELKFEMIGQITHSYTEMNSEFSKIRSLSIMAMEILMSEKKYSELFALFLEKIRSNGEWVREPSQIESFKIFMEDSYLQDQKHALSSKSIHIFYFIKSIYYYIICDNKLAFDYAKKGMEYMENQNNKVPVDTSIYSARVANVCEICLRGRDFNNFELYLEKVRNCPADYQMEKNKVFYRYNDLFLRYYIISGEFKKGIEFYDSIKIEITNISKDIPKSRMIGIYYYLAYASFAISDYKNTLVWLNKLLDEKSNYRKDFHSFSRVLNCLVQLETGDYNSQESAYRATQYYLKKQNCIYQFEDLFLKFYSRIIKEINPFNLQHHYLDFKDAVLPLLKIPSESVILDYFDIISWLDSKLTSRSFSECTKINLRNLNP